MRFQILSKFRIFSVVLLTTLAACSSSDEDNYLEVKDEPLAPLYNNALNLLSAGDYKEAAKQFEEVDRQHPYSVWARRSLIMSAYAYYELGEYDDSINASRRYLTLHPGTDEAAYAQYLIAESYYQQIPDVTRDQNSTARALRAFQEVSNRYPSSGYARDARNKILQVQDQLAGKEMSVGRYYLERDNYVAAINRFKSVVTDHQTTSHVEEALARLTEAYMAMGITNEAQTAAAILGHNYPASRWYKDSYSLLKSGGLEPREDKKSWISNVWRVVGGGEEYAEQ